MSDCSQRPKDGGLLLSLPLDQEQRNRSQCTGQSAGHVFSRNRLEGSRTNLKSVSSWSPRGRQEEGEGAAGSLVMCRTPATETQS